ncbi:uncharacterized protein LOC6542248 [Drosophila erecta]|uniref:Uncharacterized protein n=1 Tax=Drosophila erecta TaxID=7220 RepID=B3N7V3_DROER|nr:uncharacterized protein LOC6542248 [Drosophila erecta]EDV58314.2 uncharacterized protein Dere_GG16679 [Drosophila erecta]
MEPCRTLLLIIPIFLQSHLSMTTKKKPVLRNSQSNQVHHEHYIMTSECHIPYIIKSVKSKKRNIKHDNVCSNDNSLIKLRFDDKIQQYVLYVNDSVAQLKLASMEKKSPNLVGYNCSYRAIRGVNRNFTFDAPVVLGDEVPFWNGYTVPRTVDGIRASCRSELAKDLQSNSFALVQPRKAYAPLFSWHRRPSVIMIGLDGISQINFRRNFPIVFNHLKMQGWFKMDGYTDIGENTQSNLLAVLTGYSPHTLMNLKCNASGNGCLKTVPLIWKHFKKKGYITAYGGGMSDVTIFNSVKNGFFEGPIDFNARHILEQKNGESCIDRRLNIKYSFDYCKEFLKRHSNSSRPVLGIFFANGMPHKSYDNDKIQAELLDIVKKFKEMGILTKSIVVLFSYPVSSVQEKKRNFLGESLPILYIWLPSWFRALRPEIVQALRINSKRLTSPYDLHLTLQHLLELGERWPHAVDKLVDCPTCQTLFAPVPENRTCSDAGIGESNCPCDTYKLLNTNQIKHLSLGKLLVRSINQFLYHHNLQELCYNLTLKSIKMVLQRKDRKLSSGSTYRVYFTATPNNPEFSTTTRYNHNRQELEYINVESINRLNHYQNDSSCMRRLRGRKFCICKSRILEEISVTAKGNVKNQKKSKRDFKKEVPNKNKVDISLYDLPEMRESDQNIEIISV